MQLQAMNPFGDPVVPFRISGLGFTLVVPSFHFVFVWGGVSLLTKVEYSRKRVPLLTMGLLENLDPVL